jgi:hypothetical protein
MIVPNAIVIPNPKTLVVSGWITNRTPYPVQASCDLQVPVTPITKPSSGSQPVFEQSGVSFDRNLAAREREPFHLSMTGDIMTSVLARATAGAYPKTAPLKGTEVLCGTFPNSITATWKTLHPHLPEPPFTFGGFRR